jgi:hypothetical protein
MSTRAVLVVAATIILITMSAILIEQYRICMERKYADCPRPGRLLYSK